jgi:hypothetical protein
MSAPASSHMAGVSRIRIELVPPAMYHNANQEQDFTLPYTSQSVQHFDGQLSPPILNAAKKASTEVRYVSGIVSTNRVRLGYIDTSGVVQSRIPDRLQSTAESLRTMAVPVVFHYQPATLRITRLGEDGTTVWQKTVSYHLDPSKFPQKEIASTWKRRNISSLACSVTPAEIAQEPYEFHGDTQIVIFASSDAKLAVHMEVQAVCNSKTKEPMTFYMDRVYALRKIALLGDAELF